MPSKLQISGPIASKPMPLPTSFQQFKSNPIRFVANRLYASQPPIAPTLPGPRWQAATSISHTNDSDPSPSISRSKHGEGALITLVCISDTHNTTPSGIPDGDILLHAGDLAEKGTFAELQSQLNWLNTLPHPHKIVIAGNHDTLLDEAFISNHPERIDPEDISRQDQLKWGNITYLNNNTETITVRGRSITVFGSPLTPQCGTFAFQYPPIRDVWKGVIPDRTDIVLTHGPPKGHLDQGGKGCEWLLRELWRSKPQVVVFGHIHEGRGSEDVCWDAVQRGYDFPGLMRVVLTGFALGWWYMRSAFGKIRSGRTSLVNAAVHLPSKGSFLMAYI